MSADTIVPGSSPLTVWPSDAVASGAWSVSGGGPANPQDLNRYSYVNNNPVRNTDPTGHCGAGQCALAGAAAGSVIPGAGTAVGGIIGAALDIAVIVGVAAGIAYVASEAVNNGNPEAEPDPLKQRADELHGLLDPVAQDRRTTAVVRGEKDGEQIDIVGSSSQRLDPKQRAALRPGEVEAIGPGHAEVTALDYAKRNGITPQSVAASRPICPPCAERIQEAGAKPVSPLRKPR